MNNLMNARLKEIAPAWRALERATHLGPIRDEAHYDEMVALINALIDEVGSDEQHPLSGLLYLVGEVIRDYETEHYSLAEVSGIEMLRFLMDRSYAIVEDRKNKGIESYIGGKDLCLSHFGYTS
jgi:HTH-type transcriptional regulator / antitoxin HigA